MGKNGVGTWVATGLAMVSVGETSDPGYHCGVAQTIAIGPVRVVCRASNSLRHLDFEKKHLHSMSRAPGRVMPDKKSQIGSRRTA